MAITLKELELEYRETVHSLLIGMCLEGECYAFAIALSRGLDWPMVGLMRGNEIRHVAILNPDKTLRDVRGRVDEIEFGKPFGISPPYDLKAVTEEDVKMVKPIPEYLIESILKKAQVIWPDLPWKAEISLKCRVISFAEGLEELSRKHGLWIYGAIPATPPVIEEGQGNEAGYELKPTMDGFNFFFNRVLR